MEEQTKELWLYPFPLNREPRSYSECPHHMILSSGDQNDSVLSFGGLRKRKVMFQGENLIFDAKTLWLSVKGEAVHEKLKSNAFGWSETARRISYINAVWMEKKNSLSFFLILFYNMLQNGWLHFVTQYFPSKNSVNHISNSKDRSPCGKIYDFCCLNQLTLWLWLT